MRGFAATMVVFHHVYTRFSYLFVSDEPAQVHQILSFISDLNVEAVLLFFVLSGFSIRLSLQKGLPISKNFFNEYIYRRLKRILPLYYVAIIFTIISGLITHAIYANNDFDIPNLLGNIFFLQCSKSYKGNWFAPYGDNGPLWSLSFEMFYYFFFPVFILLVLKILKTSIISEKNNRIILVITLAFSLACLIINNTIFFPYVAFAALFYIWYCGFYLAEIYSRGEVALNKNFITSITIVLLTGILSYLRSSAGLYKLFFGSAITSAFFIIYTLRRKYKFFIRYFDKGFNFVFYHIGKGSYALYLLHYPLILILKYYRQINITEVVISIIIFTFFCTWLEQYFVKKKWLFLKIRYIG